MNLQRLSVALSVISMVGALAASIGIYSMYNEKLGLKNEIIEIRRKSENNNGDALKIIRDETTRLMNVINDRCNEIDNKITTLSKSSNEKYDGTAIDDNDLKAKITAEVREQLTAAIEAHKKKLQDQYKAKMVPQESK